MWNWFFQHATAVQAVVGVVTAAIWITYLQVFVESMRRGRRSEILITLGGNRGLSGHVLISNLGLEPIYILDIMLTCHTPSDSQTVSVADRTEIDPTKQTSIDLATLQRPLKSGEFVEIGTVDTLLNRAVCQQPGRHDNDLTRIDITVAAVTAAASGIVAARRNFRIEHRTDHLILRPKTLYADQIRSRRGRRSIERQLREAL